MILLHPGITIPVKDLQILILQLAGVKIVVRLEDPIVVDVLRGNVLV